VTHDQIEALSMGDRIAVMNKGRIVQLGNPLEVYDNPADTFVGGFIGTPPMNFLEAKVSGPGAASIIEVSGGSFEFPGDVAALAGHNLLLGIRAEAIGVETATAEGLVRAKVIVLEPLGSHNLLTVRCGADMLKVSISANLFPLADSDVWLRLEPARIRWMDRDTGTAIHTGAEQLATETAVVIS
ncbi:MAG: TOBE domain-containing protein, partial [Actinobacteria bacterium]|nr:TOBE domain-containing protein [Actinomycetota bacterium]